MRSRLDDFLAYIRKRQRSKGFLNVISGLLRYRFPEANCIWLAELARLKYWRRASPRLRVVQIETLAGCNYSCSFCPISTMEFDKGRMTEQLYLRILSQLGDFEGALHLQFRNEPFIDKRLPSWIELASKATKAEIVVQTNGSLLSRETIERVGRLCTLVVNDYLPGHPIIAKLKPISTEQKVIFVPRALNEKLSNRAGNVRGRPHVLLGSFCVRPFETMVIAYDGSVALCCQDWGLEAKVGNTNDETLAEIWHGSKMRTVRERLMRRERTGLCSRCDFPGV